MPPAVSVVTVCYHNPVELEQTLAGLAELDRSLFEVIAVDGSRDDSCTRVAGKFPAFHYLKGSDHGKFDAMNKGIDAAQGKAVLFMNSGDELHSAAVLADIVREHGDRLATTIIYGDCIRVVNGEHIRTPAPDLNPAGLRRGILPSHQSILIPVEYHRRHRYDDQMYFAADTKFLKRAFSDLPRIHVPLPIGVFAYGGVCTTPRSWSLLWRQYRELCEAGELRFLERFGVAFTLVRRKLFHRIVGMEGLQRMQARRLKRSLAQSA